MTGTDKPRRGVHDGETYAERWARLRGGTPDAYGYGGGSSGDRMRAIKAAIDAGRGDEVAPGWHEPIE